MIIEDEKYLLHVYESGLKVDRMETCTFDHPDISPLGIYKKFRKISSRDYIGSYAFYWWTWDIQQV